MRPIPELEQFQHQLRSYKSFSALQSAVLESEQHLELLEHHRSVCWKIFLLFRDLDQSKWLSDLADSRAAYDSLRSHYLRAVQNPDELETAVDPLTEGSESPWTVLHHDETMRQEIFQDVERCMPENTYFRQPETQGVMLDVLFIYSKLNPDVGYRQGMHELLAFVLWVVERDSIQTDESLLAMELILDSKYVEHDTFTLFTAIMRVAKSFYDPAGVITPTSMEIIPSGKAESAMVIRSKRIFTTLLPQFDPELAAYLVELDIVPQIFLMRWIRLLFGREFDFSDTLQMWDLLFADDPSLELIDYVCVSMLLRIRWLLLDSDTNEALMLLMRYPTAGPQARSFIEDARYLRSHNTTEAGNDIVKRRTDRAPAPFRPQSQRPSTRKLGTSPGTPSSFRARSPFTSPGVSSTFESLINNAARNAMNQGEKWGFNQAVRDAVGEVKKNVQNLQNQRPSPRASVLGPSHRSGRSSDISGNIAANVLRKINAMDERNKQLAKMLEAAVTDLWSAEKDAADKKSMSEESLQTFSMAVAKVQFVQVFLQDSTLPLPHDDSQPEPISNPIPEIDIPEQATAEVVTEWRPAEPDILDQPAPRNEPILAPAFPVLTRTTGSPPPDRPTTSLSAHHASAVAPSIAQRAPPKSNDAEPSTSRRPRIEQSSYSWMLGQEPASSSEFVRASPFTATEKKPHANHHKKAKGFLFGEDEDVVGERRVVKGRTRKGSKDVRKGSAIASTDGVGGDDDGTSENGESNKTVVAAGPI